MAPDSTCKLMRLLTLLLLLGIAGCATSQPAPATRGPTPPREPAPPPGGQEVKAIDPKEVPARLPAPPPRKTIAELGAALKRGDARPGQTAWELVSRGEAAAPALVAALQSQRPEVRAIAAWGLGQLGRAGASSALARTLKDPSPRVVASGAWALGRLKDRSRATRRALLALLRHKDDLVRASAVEALGQLGGAGPGVVEGLVRALGDRAHPVKVAAATALGRLGPRAAAAAAALARVAKITDGERPADEMAYYGSADDRTAAVVALGQIGPRARRYTMDLFRLAEQGRYPLRHVAAAQVGKVGGPLLPKIIKEVEKSSSIGFFGKVLASFGPRAVPTLIKMLERRSSHGMDATYGLGEMGVAAVPRLIKALSHRDAVVRSSVADALGNIGYSYGGSGYFYWYRESEQPTAAAAVDALLRAAKDTSPDVRRSACRALGRTGRGHPRLVLPTLMDALADPQAGVKEAAIVALGHMGAKAADAVPRLRRLLDDAALLRKTTAVHRAAMRTLGAIGPAAGEAAPALVRHLAGKDRDLRRAAEVGLRKMGPAAAEQVQSLLKHPDPKLRRVAVDILGAAAMEALPETLAKLIIPAMDTGNAWHSKQVLSAIAKLGPTALDRLLRVVATSKSTYTRANALKALTQIVQRRRRAQGGAPDPRVVAAIKRAQKDKEGHVRRRALVALAGVTGVEALPAIRGALASKDKYMRGTAADALATLGARSRPALAALIKLLGDKDEDVRKDVLWALKKLGPAAAPGILPLHRARLLDEWAENRETAGRVLDGICPAARRVETAAHGAAARQPAARQAAGIAAGTAARGITVQLSMIREINALRFLGWTKDGARFALEVERRFWDTRARIRLRQVHDTLTGKMVASFRVGQATHDAQHAHWRRAWEEARPEGDWAAFAAKHPLLGTEPRRTSPDGKWRVEGEVLGRVVGSRLAVATSPRGLRYAWTDLRASKGVTRRPGARITLRGAGRQEEALRFRLHEFGHGNLARSSAGIAGGVDAYWAPAGGHLLLVRRSSARGIPADKRHAYPDVARVFVRALGPQLRVVCRHGVSARARALALARKLAAAGLPVSQLAPEGVPRPETLIYYRGAAHAEAARRLGRLIPGASRIQRLRRPGWVKLIVLLGNDAVK